LPLRLVLDTNVWLDWLVFDDAGVASLKAASAAGQAEIFIDAACENELASVLAYRLRKEALTASTQAACMAECRRVARMVGSAAPSPFAPAAPSPACVLPVCRDADDQKFLELARDCRADFLVTKDLMLLELDRRKVRRAPFRIVTPAQLNVGLAATSIHL
jgi:putative PIN family toxin of toxin-antitoxin system